MAANQFKVPLDKTASEHPKRSEAAKAADALANEMEDRYPAGKNYKDAGAEDGPNPRPKTVSRVPNEA